MTKGTILVVGSNATSFDLQGGTVVTTGNYLNETVVPVMALIAAGYGVVLATPSGKKPLLDERSRSAEHFEGDEAAFRKAEDFFANDAAMNRVQTLRAVIEQGLDRFAGVFVPGGHAPVVDLIQDPGLREILRHFHARRQPTALLCHGLVAILAALPRAKDFRAALVASDTAKAKDLSQGWQYAGYKMTIFSNSEEKIVEDHIFHAKLPFHVADALETAGGVVENGAINFAPHVIEDRELITGQNPRSDHLLGEHLVKALDRQAAQV